MSGGGGAAPSHFPAEIEAARSEQKAVAALQTGGAAGLGTIIIVVARSLSEPWHEYLTLASPSIAAFLLWLASLIFGRIDRAIKRSSQKYIEQRTDEEIERLDTSSRVENLDSASRNATNEQISKLRIARVRSDYAELKKLLSI